MNRDGNALPDDDPLEIDRQSVEGESALDAFEFEPASTGIAPQVDDDPMDFFADEGPVPGVLELPAELSEVSGGGNPEALVRVAGHISHSESHASAAALVLAVVVTGVFTTMVLVGLIPDQRSPAALIVSTDVAPLTAVARSVPSFPAKPIVVESSDLAPAVSTASHVPDDREENTRPEPEVTVAVAARPTVRGLAPTVPAILSPESPRGIESSDPQVPAAPPAPALASAPERNIEIVPLAPKPPTEASRPPTDADVIQRVLARYRAAFNVLDSGAAKAVWPSVDTRALGRAFERLEAQNLVFANCDVAVTGAQASASCNGTASYVPKVGHRASFVESRQWRFELKKSGTDWVIDQVDAR